MKVCNSSKLVFYNCLKFQFWTIWNEWNCHNWNFWPFEIGQKTNFEGTIFCHIENYSHSKLSKIRILAIFKVQNSPTLELLAFQNCLKFQFWTIWYWLRVNFSFFTLWTVNIWGRLNNYWWFSYFVECKNFIPDLRMEKGLSSFCGVAATTVTCRIWSIYKEKMF